MKTCKICGSLFYAVTFTCILGDFCKPKLSCDKPLAGDKDMLTEAVRLAIEEYDEAESVMREIDISENALNACETEEDWQACIDAFGGRVVGSYVANEADEFASNDAWGNGIGFITMNDGQAIVSEWNSQGFYSVWFTSAEKAAKAVEEAIDEWNCDDEEEAED